MNIYKTDTKPWYKYPWPWVAIGIIIWTFLSGAGMLWFSSQVGKPSMVEGYNKVGKIITQNNQMHKNARKFGIEASITRNQNKFNVSISPEKYSGGDIELVFVHPTDETRDIRPELNMDKGVISGEMPENIEGWLIRLRSINGLWEVRNKFASKAQTMVKMR